VTCVVLQQDLLRAVIPTGGGLLGLSVLNQSVVGELASAATDAVKQWHYEATLPNGVPVEVVTTIAVTFRLESGKSLPAGAIYFFGGLIMMWAPAVPGYISQGALSLGLVDSPVDSGVAKGT